MRIQVVANSTSLRKYNGRACPYCTRPMMRYPLEGSCSPTKDHVRPQWDGGTFKIVCCRRCNNDKAHHFLSEWIAELARLRDPRLEHVTKIAEKYPHLAKPRGRLRPSCIEDGRLTDAERLLAELRSG